MSNENEQTETKSARKRRLAKEYNASVTNVPNRIPTIREREELNALSKDVFGASNRWQRLVNDGFVEAQYEELDEVLPGEKEGDPDIVKKVQVAVKRSDGRQLHTVKRFTIDSVREYMIERKVQLEKMRAEIARLQAEEKAKKEQEKLAESVNQAAGGSAV